MGSLIFSNVKTDKTSPWRISSTNRWRSMLIDCGSRQRSVESVVLHVAVWKGMHNIVQPLNKATLIYPGFFKLYIMYVCCSAIGTEYLYSQIPFHEKSSISPARSWWMHLSDHGFVQYIELQQRHAKDYGNVRWTLGICGGGADGNNIVNDWMGPWTWQSSWIHWYKVTSTNSVERPIWRIDGQPQCFLASQCSESSEIPLDLISGPGKVCIAFAEGNSPSTCCLVVSWNRVPRNHLFQ